MLLGILEG